MYSETVKDHGADRDCFIYCGVNTYWEDRDIELPIIPEHMQWYREAYTFDDEPEEKIVSGRNIHLAPRSLMLLIGK